MAEDDRERDLDELRGRIDAIDRQIIGLLNERAAIVVEVGRRKRSSGAPIYAPAREAEVLARVLAANRGPLSDRCIEGIYRELMSGSFALERPLRIGYLGPQGSHSHAAARVQFGASVEYEDLHAIEGVFTEVRRGHVDYGLVPIENSTGGSVVETFDAFREARTEVFAYAEVQMGIRHCLLADCGPSEVKTIYSKPEVFTQCRRWVQTQYPHAHLISAPSSSRAVIMAKEQAQADPQSGSAAIGTKLAGELYGMRCLFESIEDNPKNLTRFLVISREKARRTGDDKTSIMFSIGKGPGTLVRVLSIFADAGINLTHIDKRPTGSEHWSYTFFVDAAGHQEDPAFAAVLKIVAKQCQDFDVLGSYPASRRIL